jgi:hypothetical protein
LGRLATRQVATQELPPGNHRLQRGERNIVGSATVGLRRINQTKLWAG